MVVSRVPQGTVLGPIVFLLYISEIDSDLQHTQATSFADDTRLLKIIATAEDCELMQEDLVRLYGWAQQNNMVFNASKFELMRYVLGAEDVWNYQYSAPDGSPIEQKQQLRDLGVIMSDTAKFEDQIKAVVVKSKQQTGWIFRSFSTREAYPMLTLFRAMVLPLIEYCCQIWSPRTVGNIRLLESVQRTFTNRISGMQHMD